MRGHIRKRNWTSKAGKTSTRYHVVVDIGVDDDTGNRKQVSRGGYKTRREAETQLNRVLQELETGTYIAADDLTVKDYVEDLWLPAMRTQVKAATLDSYQRIAKCHVVPRLGRKRLQTVTASDLNRLYSDLLTEIPQKRKHPLSVKTVRNVHVMVSKVLSDAVRDGVLPRNVAAVARPPRTSEGSAPSVTCWSAGELKSFLEGATDDPHYVALHLAAHTGMRRGEVLGLRWQDLDFEHHRLSVRQALTSVSYQLKFSTPKSGKARVVDLDVNTVAILKSARRGQKETRLAYGPGYSESDLVFTTEAGDPIHPDRFTQVFDRIVKHSGLPRIRLHDLRHTHATIALRAGIPVKVVSERLGHATAAFTMSVYQHVMPGMQAEAASQIAALIDSATPVVAQDA